MIETLRYGVLGLLKLPNKVSITVVIRVTLRVFKKIGDKYGPFDLTLIETGAYNRDWADIHMMPEESVQAHIDLRGKTMSPVHNSNFDLSFHPWYEPLERVNVAAQKRKVNLTTPIVGEVFTATQKAVSNQWWKKSQLKQ